MLSGAKNIGVGWDDVSQIIASWFIAPVIKPDVLPPSSSLISKFFVLERKNFSTSLNNAPFVGSSFGVHHFLWYLDYVDRGKVLHLLIWMSFQMVLSPVPLSESWCCCNPCT